MYDGPFDDVLGTVRLFLRGLVYGPEADQLRRFFAVGVIAAGLQTLLLWAFVEYGGIQYLIAAVIAIEITIVFQYVLNNAWTFRVTRHVRWQEYVHGLVKTNFVRGTAIPLQLGILYALVDFAGFPYLIANLIAIGGSGIYRYTLDSRWTWG